VLTSRNSRMKVVVARTLPPAGLDRLEARFDVQTGGLPFDRGWLLEHVAGASAIVTDPTVPVTASCSTAPATA
jgi:hypothetical protein